MTPGRGGRPWAGALAAALLVVSLTAACGSQDSEVARDGEGVSQVSVSITIEDGAVDPPPGRTRVSQGDLVILEVIGDTADEVHVHGYDHLTDLVPGEAAMLRFVADRTGLFEVETHGSGLVLTQLEVR